MILRSGKLDSTHPSRTSVKSDQVFLVSSQSCVSTLTHYSSELLLPRHQKLNDLTTDLVMTNNNRVSKRNDVLQAFAGTNWGQHKETLLLTYKTLGRSIAIYAAPVWSTNASDTSLEKIQRTHNEALRIITGSHKMSSIDHLHSETEMLLVKDHLNLLSVQYLVHCLDTDNVYHHNGSSTEGYEGDTFH